MSQRGGPRAQMILAHHLAGSKKFNKIKKTSSAHMHVSKRAESKVSSREQSRTTEKRTGSVWR
jgi:hypothetical protein